MSQPRSVLELSAAGDEPSPEYIVKGCSYAPADMSSCSSASFPVIDMSLFSQSSPAADDFDFQVNNALNTLRSALASTGCFQIIGHGMSNSFIDKLRGIAKEFYELPEEEKQKYARVANEIEGYGSDRIVSQDQVLDWCYRLCLKIFPQHIRRPDLWPHHPPHFSQVLDEYALKMKSILETLYKAMARSLNVDENSFLKQLGEKSEMQARFNYLPKCARPDLVLGIKPHTDKTGLTILLQDTIAEGLQVLVDDKWVRVPVLPYAFVVNIGDLMQIMSNGIFKSPMHRVVTNSERMRMSIVLFHEPEHDMEIGPVDALINDQTPRLYKNVTNYVSIHYKSYMQGIVPLDTLKI